MRAPLAVLALLLTFVASLLGLAPAARADGFLVPTRPDRRVRGDWAVTYHRVDVIVEGQKAHVRVDQEFTNLAPFPLESEYVFPLPAGAMVSSVTLMVDGKGLEGRLLRAEEARRIYDEIVRRQKDPALVEYVGRDFFRASIFPIPPGGSRQLVLEYDQLLPKDGETIELLYPLNTEKFSAKPLRDVRVQVEIRSQTGVGSIYCPSHDVVVSRPDAKRAKVVFEAREIRPETDFLLYWGESGADVGATLLTHWPRGEDRGYFLFLASPTLPDGTASAAKPKDLTLCVDVSGSMAGVKLEQTKSALRQVLGGLNDGDVFNVITYHSGVVPLWDTGKPLTAETRKEAMEFVEGLKATGGTNISGALEAALARAEHAGPAARDPVPDRRPPDDGHPEPGRDREARRRRQQGGPRADLRVRRRRGREPRPARPHRARQPRRAHVRPTERGRRAQGRLALREDPLPRADRREGRLLGAGRHRGAAHGDPGPLPRRPGRDRRPLQEGRPRRRRGRRARTARRAASSTTSSPPAPRARGCATTSPRASGPCVASPS